MMFQDPQLRTLIAIAGGAILGAWSRYYLTLLFAQWLGTAFPYGTFFINLSGCLGMGFLITLATERLPNFSPDLKLMLTTGFLGAYTTFSTYGLDTILLARSGNFWLTGGYWAGSAVLGVLGVQLGVALARWMHPG